MAHAEVVQVIRTSDLRGKGTPEAPYWRTTQYFTLDGVLLWETPEPSTRYACDRDALRDVLAKA